MKTELKIEDSLKSLDLLFKNSILKSKLNKLSEEELMKVVAKEIKLARRQKDKKCQKK